MTYLDIDTLLISGGGINSISSLGCLKYLIDNNLIDKELKIFKNIIGVSGGLIHILPIIVGYTIDETIDLYIKVDINNYLPDISLKYLLDNYGIYDNSIIKHITELILKHKNINKKINLLDLYKLTKKNIYFKTINITREKVLFINHKNYPNLLLSDALCMTSAAPPIFKPIKYKNNMYIDGGFCGNFPFDKENKYKKYIGINITINHLHRNRFQKNKNKNKNKINNLLDYLKLLFKLSGTQLRESDNKNRIININLTGSGLNFKEKNKKKNEILNLGYKKTYVHFNNIIEGIHNHKSQ